MLIMRFRGFLNGPRAFTISLMLAVSALVMVLVSMAINRKDKTNVTTPRISCIG